MPKRKYKTCPKALVEQGRLIVKSNNDARYIHRVEMVNLVASNFQNGTVFLSNWNGGYWLLPLASFQGRFWPQNSGVA